MEIKTMRERMLALIQGREHDRVPFVQYSNIAAPNDEIWSVIGRENMGLVRWSVLHRLESPNCRMEQEEIHENGRRGLRSAIITPSGRLTEEKFFEPTYNSASIRKHFIRESEDYHIFMEYLRDIKVIVDTSHYLQSVEELGDDGWPMAAVLRTPYQQMWVQWVSLEDLCGHMAEYPDIVEDCFELLAGIELKVFDAVIEAIKEVPVPFINIPDNITAPAIGPRFFDRYCLPLYQELSGRLAEKNIPVYVHMDGDLKPLWKSIGESGILGLDSMSPPPDNDTSVADARRLWPDMRICANFPSSVHLAEPEVIYQRAVQMIQDAGGVGRLQIQISENVPPGVWRKSYPEIVRAIRDCC